MNRKFIIAPTLGRTDRIGIGLIRDQSNSRMMDCQSLGVQTVPGILPLLLRFRANRK